MFNAGTGVWHVQHTPARAPVGSMPNNARATGTGVFLPFADNEQLLPHPPQPTLFEHDTASVAADTVPSACALLPRNWEY